MSADESDEYIEPSEIIHSNKNESHTFTAIDSDASPHPADGVPKVPRVVTNPRPKLDAERLLDERRGLPELLKMTNSFTFHPGNEVEDMRKLLNIYELWAHRLFPKFTFDDFLEKCEALGKKRAIKTHLRKLNDNGSLIKPSGKKTRSFQ